MTKTRQGRPELNYGFDRLEIDKCILVPVDEQTCTWRSFQVQVSAASKKLGRVLYARKRKDGAFECWREA